MSSSRSKYILFFNDIVNDGYGDLGHLIDIASPENLKSLSDRLPITIGPDEANSTKENFRPVYLISCEDKPATIEFVLNSLKDCGILKDLASRPPSMELKTYVAELLTKNPQVHLVFYDFPALAQKALDKTRAYLKKIKEEEDDEILLNTAASKLKINTDRMQQDLLKEEIRNIINNYISTQPLLQEQLKTTEAIEWVSTKKYSIPAFDQQPVMQTFLAEQGVATENSPTLRGMGFSSLDHGLLLKRPSCTTLDEKAAVLAEMQNKIYLRSLLETEEDSDLSLGSAKKFLEETLYVPGYFQNVNATAIFLQGLACSPLAKKYKNLALHLNGKAFKKDSLDLNLLAENGVSSLEINQPGSPPELIKINGAKGNRRLRIFSDFWLKDEDYHRLYKISQTLGGCSGDKSIELCLSNFLIPIYQVRKWKQKFSADFKAIAELYSDTDPSITQFMDILSKLENTTIKAEQVNLALALSSLLTDDFVAKWKPIIAKIHEKHNYYDKLPKFIYDGILTKKIIDLLNEKNFEGAVKIMRCQENEILAATLKLAKKFGQEEAAAFIYYFYPQAGDRLSDKDKHSLDSRILNHSFYNTVKEEDLTLSAKNKRKALIYFMELAETVKSGDYPQAVASLKEKNKAFISYLFERALSLKLYELAAFIYLSPKTVAAVSLNSDEKALLECIKIKKYSGVQIGNKAAFFSNEATNTQKFTATALKEFLDVVMRSVCSHKFSSTVASEIAAVARLEEICKDSDLALLNKLAQIEEILKNFDHQGKFSFSYYLIDAIQNPEDSCLLLKEYFNLPYPKISEEAYPRQFTELSQNLHRAIASLEQAALNPGPKHDSL